MHVELWGHFKMVLTSVWPLLTDTDKQTCNIVVKWADNQGNHYAGIDQTPIDQTKDWLKGIRDQKTGQIRTDLTNAITFLTRLNKKPLAGYYNTEAACSRFGFYFYDGVCNEHPRRIPAPPFPPPKPPPPPVPPEPIPPEFLAEDFDLSLTVLHAESQDMIKGIYGKAKNYLDYYDSYLGDAYWEWSWDMAMQQAQNEQMKNNMLDPILAWTSEVRRVIGDVVDLEGISIIDTIKAVQSSGDAVVERKVNFVFDTLGVTLHENNITVITPGDSMLARLKAMVAKWVDQGETFGEMSTEGIAKILEDDFDIVTGTINGILARLSNIEEEFGISIEQVTLDLEKPIYEKGEGIDFLIPVSMLVFKDVIALLVDKIWGALDTIIDTFTTPINFLLQEVYEISDPWLGRLKKKLGDVGGEYDLETDTLYQTLRSEVDVIIDDIYGLPDEWVEVLANRLQGYFSTGIGEKGEKGDPGRPGAQGVQGIPGVKGEPGEPGEGVGLAIDDIDRQLKDRLVQGGAIVTANVTGVIDYNIEKIGELFTRYDLEVKPITEFLTTDMQDTLTMIAESFETPEALIAFLLDVPEGQEDVTYELMQMLVAQIMERGLP